MFKPKNVNRYTPEGRAEIHKNLSGVSISILREMMRNPIMDRSIEYNDNRLSLYCGQMGRCYVTKQPLELGHITAITVYRGISAETTNTEIWC